MRRFTLHAPPPSSVPSTRPARLPELVPEGFSLLAALLPPVWFLAHRLWLPLAIYIALSILAAFLLPGDVLPYAAAAAQFLIGLQAQDIRRWSLARRGLPVSGVVVARDAEAALLRALHARPDLARSAMA
ncbi:DUF2628 domain-containing protein [Roseomonas marmotae]|uniref:DUF2628 domain-containing protein n=1 Tax=Roseomonas marmotae TaxID=2768161 RepID=A0ABS3KCE3_9PROT|nr:DUF2628 domain-containing protein [Roseomonas marmotae]MBO1075143.1 DUF2628 domain-containing protein [Roseomonas marmotae]QTI79745.1 DUF2628 domain-containing protein [Roseomonas marmotae]